MFEKINEYYQSKFSELPFPKQFHYASRSWLWDQDKFAAEFLRKAKDEFCGSNPPESVKHVLQEIIDNQSPEFGSKNAAAQRAPYFAKYPLLRTVLPLLFRLLFIESVYGFDAREALLAHLSTEQLDKLSDDLLADPEAVAILSTHASNFLYLYHRFYLKDEDGVPVEKLYDMGQTNYDLTDKTQLQLYIYLYTHCIIGESLFYKHPIAASKQEIYQKMAMKLDEILQERFSDINLDNKFEILVCFKICGFKSTIGDKIYEEADKSWSKDGDFLIDIHNKNPQRDNITLEKSEHRNVLAVMSKRNFTPTDQVIR